MLGAAVMLPSATTGLLLAVIRVLAPRWAMVVVVMMVAVMTAVVLRDRRSGQETPGAHSDGDGQHKCPHVDVLSTIARSGPTAPDTSYTERSGPR
jgi:MFS superfamily sulfate permease-like transporter